MTRTRFHRRRRRGRGDRRRERPRARRHPRNRGRTRRTRGTRISGSCRHHRTGPRVLVTISVVGSGTSDRGPDHSPPSSSRSRRRGSRPAPLCSSRSFDTFLSWAARTSRVPVPSRSAERRSPQPRALPQMHAPPRRRPRRPSSRPRLRSQHALLSLRRSRQHSRCDQRTTTPTDMNDTLAAPSPELGHSLVFLLAFSPCPIGPHRLRHLGRARLAAGYARSLDAKIYLSEYWRFTAFCKGSCSG